MPLRRRRAPPCGADEDETISASEYTGGAGEYMPSVVAELKMVSTLSADSLGPSSSVTRSVDLLSARVRLGDIGHLRRCEPSSSPLPASLSSGTSMTTAGRVAGPAQMPNTSSWKRGCHVATAHRQRRLKSATPAATRAWPAEAVPPGRAPGPPCRHRDGGACRTTAPDRRRPPPSDRACDDAPRRCRTRARRTRRTAGGVGGLSPSGPTW